MEELDLKKKYIQELKEEKKYWMKRFLEEEQGSKRNYITKILKDIYELSITAEKES